MAWPSRQHAYAVSGSLVDIPLLQGKVGIISPPENRYNRNS
jgi:hypothetical protein